MRRLAELWRPFGRTTTYLAPRHAVSALVTLAAVPIVVSSVEVVDYGKFVIAMAVMGWLLPLTAPFTAHGVAAAATRGLDGTLVYVVRERLKLAGFPAAIMLGIALALHRAGDHLLGNLLLAAAGYLLLGTAFLTFRQFLVGKRAFRELAPWDISMAALPSVGMAVAAFATGSIVVVAGTAFATQIVVGAAAYGWVVHRWRVQEQYALDRIDHAVRGYGLRMIPLSLISAFASEGATFVAAYVLGYQQLAVLAVADRLVGRLSRIAGDIGRDLLRPEFASRDERRVARRLRRHLGSITCALGLLWAGALMAGATYLLASMPAPYRGAVWFYAVMSLGLPARVLQDVVQLIPSVNLRAVQETVPALVGDLVRVGGTALLGYWLGAIGVAVAVAAGAWVGMAVAFYWTLAGPRLAERALTEVG